jgi:hypothetical protein
MGLLGFFFQLFIFVWSHYESRGTLMSNRFSPFFFLFCKENRNGNGNWWKFYEGLWGCVSLWIYDLLDLGSLRESNAMSVSVSQATKVYKVPGG